MGQRCQRPHASPQKRYAEHNQQQPESQRNFSFSDRSARGKSRGAFVIPPATNRFQQEAASQLNFTEWCTRQLVQLMAPFPKKGTQECRNA